MAQCKTEVKFGGSIYYCIHDDGEGHSGLHQFNVNGSSQFMHDADSVNAEIARLRSHVSRLEESLRVALEARAEAVEVLGEILPVAESHPDMGPNMSAAVDRAQSFVRRAIGKGE